MTLDYLRPAEPDKNRITQIRFRAHKDDELEITLMWGDQRRRMSKAEVDGEFVYYDVESKTGSDAVSYYFEVKAADGDFVIYDKRGCVPATMDSMKFRVFPGFSTPRWAKGAVMYQIFVDRFCNGDTSNDVESNEYFYNGFIASKVDDWYQNPDPYQDFIEFYGGDLKGVMDKLDYLQDLGIDAIYFNPIFVSPSSHKYDTQDYDHIDPHFGVIVEDGGELIDSDDSSNELATKYIARVTNRKNLEASDALFAELVEEAHKRGIRVILDGVFNHCGSFNKWLDKEKIYETSREYEKGAYVAENSPYHDFFSFYGGSWPCNGSYDGWWGYDTLPKLNYEGSKELEDYIISIGKKWVSPPYNADGWRLDVAADLGHSQEYNHRFWKRFREEVKKANSQAIILAEHYGPARGWLQGDEWDTVMNYDAFMEPLTWFLTGMDKHSDKFEPGRIGNAREFFDTMLYCGGENFSMPSLYTAMNQLSNHDHSRFLTRTNHRVGRSTGEIPSPADLGVQKCVMREAVMIQMTWPGAPTLYYGDEAGVCGFTDPDNRRTYPWGREDKEMIRFHKEMIRIHKNCPELLTGSIRELCADRNFLAFARFNRTAAAVVVINNNDFEVTKEITVWPAGIPRDAKLHPEISSDNMGFVLDGAPIRVKDGILTITLSRKSGTVLRYNSFEAVSDEEFWADNFIDFG